MSISEIFGWATTLIQSLGFLPFLQAGLVVVIVGGIIGLIRGNK